MQQTDPTPKNPAIPAAPVEVPDQGNNEELPPRNPTEYPDTPDEPPIDIPTEEPEPEIPTEVPPPANL